MYWAYRWTLAILTYRLVITYDSILIDILLIKAGATYRRNYFHFLKKEYSMAEILELSIVKDLRTRIDNLRRYL